MHEERTPQGARTGDETVDQVIAQLDGLAQRPLDEHVTVLEDVHRALEEHLAGDGRQDA